MTGSPPMSSAATNGPTVDALQSLGELRAALQELNPASAPQIVSTLSNALDQVVLEHKGMGEELLCLYEQLGIVFEVTRKLAGVQSESEVVALFLESLRRSFERRAVFAARPRLAGGWAFDTPGAPNTPWLTALVERACERGTVLVEPVPPGALPDSICEVMIGPVRSGEALVCVLVIVRPQSEPAFQASDMLLVESLTTFCGDLIRSHRLVRELREMSIAMVRSLVSAVDQKDEYTCGHSLRVAYYATALGRKLGLGEVDLQMLQWSALLHDVGKIGIRDSVLNKEGRLTPEEFEHIKEHPVRSHKVVQQVPQLRRALDGVLYHHERYDGSGYPSGLKGEDIPLQARILQIADVFDALTSNRSYRAAYDWRKALCIMEEEAGKTADPQLRRLFDDLIHEWVGDDPQAWEALVARASRFAEAMEEPVGESGGE